MRDIENAGFIVDATATREQIIYSIKALPDAANAAISTLSEAVFSPPIRDYVVSLPPLLMRCPLIFLDQ
jgi:predicted Zn-dependent peptidase